MMNRKRPWIPSLGLAMLLLFVQYVVFSNYPHPIPGIDTYYRTTRSYVPFAGRLPDRVLSVIGPVIMAPVQNLFDRQTKNWAGLPQTALGSWVRRAMQSRGAFNLASFELALTNTLVWVLGAFLVRRVFRSVDHSSTTAA